MPVKSLVAAIDLDEPSIAAARWASHVFAPDAAVTLVHVVEPPHRPRFGRHLLPEPEQIGAVAREYAATRARDIASLHLKGKARVEIRSGKPDEEINACARDVGANLVVIGPHGGRPRPSKFLGTTAERIVRTSPVSVLVVVRPPDGPARRILVPVDDTDVTPRALEWARRIAEQFDADVKLLHVWSNAQYSYVASMSLATEASEEAARAEIRSELRDAATHWLQEMSRTGIRRERVTAEVTYGHAGARTLEVAADMRADLIVIGRCGTGLVRPAVLGSTIGTVLHGARCPILVVADEAMP